MTVHASEALTGNRNRAIAWLLRNYLVVADDVDAVLDTYFANAPSWSPPRSRRDGGDAGQSRRQSGDGRETADAHIVARTLSVMTSSGMYDYAGEWIYRVGIPAKSGVGGGIVADPAFAGWGSAPFSPNLDSHGNSVRGARYCEALVVAISICICSTQRRCPAPASSPTTTSTAFHHAAAANPTNSRSSTSATADVRVVELVGALNFAAIDY